MAIKSISADPSSCAERFKAAMRHHATTVGVVTVGWQGSRSGLTVTSFCSLSVSPASLLVCTNRTAEACAEIAASGSFGLSILSASQIDVADEFAGRNGTTGEERFAPFEWLCSRPSVPLLANALAAFDCDLVGCHEGYTHRIMIGRVSQLYLNSEGPPLIYANGTYLSTSSFEEMERARSFANLAADTSASYWP